VIKLIKTFIISFQKERKSTGVIGTICLWATGNLKFHPKKTFSGTTLKNVI